MQDGTELNEEATITKRGWTGKDEGILRSMNTQQAGKF